MTAKTHKRIVIGIFAVAVVIGVFFTLLLFAADGGAGSGIGFRRIVVIRVEGVISDGSWHVRTLRECLASNSVAGVLLRVDSPGGAVAPSQELYNEVAAFMAAGKPLVVSMGNTAASGGYYIASPALKIFASPGTLTGSIGVIFTLPVYQDLAKKVGVDVRVLKAGDFKDAGSPFRQMSDKEAAHLQGLLDDTHDQFIRDAAAGRGWEVEEMRPFADGRIFTGRQALEHNLIDTLGGFEDAMAYLRGICGISESVKPIEKKPYVGWRELLMESAQKNIPALETLSRPAGLYYLFTP